MDRARGGDCLIRCNNRHQSGLLAVQPSEIALVIRPGHLQYRASVLSWKIEYAILKTVSSPYTVLVVGMGKRGMHHATAFNANPKFKVTGICDIDAARLDAAAAKLGHPEKSTNAAALGQVALPLTVGTDEQALLKAKVPELPVLVSCEQNRKEFGLG